MPGDLHHTARMLGDARLVLAVSEGRLRDRLIRAWTLEVSELFPIQRGFAPDMSDGLTARLEELHAVMTADGSPAETVSAMDENGVREAAIQLLELATDAEYESDTL